MLAQKTLKANQDKQAAAKKTEAKVSQSYPIAVELMKARRKGEKAFPSKDIQSLVEISLQVVADNFQLYPQLQGIKDDNVLKAIVKQINPNYHLNITARNVDYEFYWEKKCESLINCKKEQHGGSFKQAFIERRIQDLLEGHKNAASNPELIKELKAARYEVFCLHITQLVSHLDMSIVFQHLPNLAHLTLTFGAKYLGMQYERKYFGMKMSDAKILADSLKISQSLVYLSLPGNLIDDDLISILIKGLVLNKTISQLDLSHNRISNAGARKIAKFLLSTQVLTHLNLADNAIEKEGSRYLAQALKVNKVLKHLSLKLNRLDDKSGSKLCIDLLNNQSALESLSLSSNSLGHMFSESLAEFLKSDRSLKRLDISCNFLDESNAGTLKASLEGNPNIIEIDVRGNIHLSDDTIADLEEIVTKNLLNSKGIPYKKLTDLVDNNQNTQSFAMAPSPELQQGASPTKTEQLEAEDAQ